MIHWGKKPTQKKGIVVATDALSEWLLPWWWAHYCSYNNFPVVFVDLGMSCLGKAFCLERGEVLPFSHVLPIEIPQDTQKEWEKQYGKEIWEKRPNWFKKPFALLQTPFKQTLWLDLDCEVLASLAPLFALEGEIFLAEETSAEIAKQQAHAMIYDNENLYNSGVILYNHGTKIIEKWAQKILEQSGDFWGDQNALSRVIYEENLPIHRLDPNYNWRMSQGFNIHASIIHWVGSWGKDYIRRFGGLGDEMKSLPLI